MELLVNNVVCISILLLTLAFSSSSYSDEISGIPNISDGDTLKIWNQGIRLEGIDAPETAQTCTKKDGSTWKCGEAAANYLQKITRGKEVSCQGTKTDQYDRLLATCYMNDINLNKQLVSEGWAVAYIEYSDTYIGQEREAQQANRGIWNTKFIRPAAFRSGEWQQAGNESTASEDCVIKGNINRKGDKIYHAPWSRSYKKTKINTSKGERWFCTEDEALAVGWRAPYR